MNNLYNQNPKFNNIFHKTMIIKKPITGIVTGYHELPYILIAPDYEDTSRSIEVTGLINVSPKFIISTSSLDEKFSDVFDSKTFDDEIQGRFFSFAYGNKKNLKVESEYFKIKTVDKNIEKYIEEVEDRILSEENIKTSIIHCPEFKYYPISIDKFINSIVNREFNF